MVSRNGLLLFLVISIVKISMLVILDSNSNYYNSSIIV